MTLQARIALLITKIKTDFNTLSTNIIGKVQSFTITELRAYTGTAISTVYINDALKTGTFEYQSGNSSSSDDGAMIIVTADGKRYQRVTDRVKPEYWGAIPNGSFNSTTAVQNAFNYAQSSGMKAVYFSSGSYMCNSININECHMYGVSPNSSKLKCNGGTEIIRMGYDVPHFKSTYIENLGFDGDNNLYDAIQFVDTDTPNTEISGRAYIENCYFLNCNRAVYKPTGNIGNYIGHTVFQGNNYNYFAIGDDTPFMQAGFDELNHCVFNSTKKAGIYINSSTGGTGGTIIRRLDAESNPGFVIFIENYTTSFNPLLIDGYWPEGNATTGSVNIEGTNYTPSDIYIKNCDNFNIQHSSIAQTKIINSKGKITNTTTIFGTTTLEADSSSSVIVDDLTQDGLRSKVPILSVRRNSRDLSGQNSALVVPKPINFIRTNNAILTNTLSQIIGYTFPGSTGTTSVPIYDPYIFNFAAQVVMPNTQVNWPITTVNLQTNKFYYMSVAIKPVSGAIPTIHWTYGIPAATGIHESLTTGIWTNTAVFGKCTVSGSIVLYINNTTGASVTLRYQALQVVQFDTEYQMIEYFNSKTLAVDTPQTIYTDTVPTIGTWLKGDNAVKVNPTSGSIGGWVCVTSGSPGVWKENINISS